MTTTGNIGLSSVENGNATTVNNDAGPKRLISTRHIQVLLSFFLIFIAYGIRVTLSVGIVAMMDPKASPNPNVPTYPEWQNGSIMLSSFFWGYLIPQVVAGQLAKKYGPKWFLVSTMALCALFTLLLPPMAAQFGSTGVMVCRAIQGIGQGFTFPMTHDTLSRWVPTCERSRLGTFVYAGGSFGTVVSMVVTGLISGSWWGWPLVFYLYGGLGFIWVILMSIFGSNSPYEHPTISEKEKHFITSGVSHSEKEHPTPWKRIFSSLPVWALVIVHCGQNWGFWTLMTEIPTYLSGVMDFKIQSNSVLSALPYFTLWILSFLFSEVADRLINKGVASIGVTRKILNSIGIFIPAGALVCLAFVSKDQQTLAVALLTVAVGINGAIYSGFHVNHIDLSPNYSGILMGLTNGLSNVFALLAPLFVQVVVTDATNALQWRTVFLFAATIYVATNLVFIIFGSGELQEWNDNEQLKTKGTSLVTYGSGKIKN